jgi:hypothetical protein
LDLEGAILIYGIVGMTDDQRPENVQRSSPCGNGKTNLLTHFLYSEFCENERKIICNFHTRFIGAPWGTPSWSTYMTAQEIFDNWWDPELEGAAIGITELESIINSAGRSSKVITYLEKCLNQRRKAGYDIFYDTQRWFSSDRRMRDKTDYIWRPEKYHCEYIPEADTYMPTERCPLDICNEKHLILVYQEYPPAQTIIEKIKPQIIIKSWEIGQLYDTKEKMMDILQYNPAWEHINA